MSANSSSSRFVFIDYWRFLAIISMILYHLFFDLVYFGFVNLDLSEFPFSLLQLFSGVSFVFISGITLNLSKTQQKIDFNRFFLLLVVALLISISTWFFSNASFIKFGVIHLLACATLLNPFISKLSNFQKFVFSILVILLGVYFGSLSTEFDFLFFINLTSNSYSSFDHYPLFPWLGVFCLGSLFATSPLCSFLVASTTSLNQNPLVEKISRNSLIIYLIHQPLLLSLLFFYFYLIRIIF